MHVCRDVCIVRYYYSEYCIKPMNLKLSVSILMKVNLNLFIAIIEIVGIDYKDQ